MTSQRTRDRLVKQLQEQGIRDARVLEVIRAIPRHLFVDEALASRAYENIALPIGYGQTISQPYIVARMTEALLEDGPLGKVLEIGTGSGYQTAVLASVAAKVYSIERIRALSRRAREVLAQLRLHNVSLRHSDGTLGWKDNGPYDGIIVTAAAAEVPLALLEQLAPAGRLVIPVGEEGGVQQLIRIRRTPDAYEQESLGAVVFVPLRAGDLA
ncbi:MAG: protein-L-isoaspartate(D-aspartate) O-methyltransferase [Ectothiorhodospiraceae bacterium]|nr:protein-L-isoaspartate(D-aspartate) O-methyltransferase [Ectothiorhodospiraceae bacterium]